MIQPYADQMQMQQMMPYNYNYGAYQQPLRSVNPYQNQYQAMQQQQQTQQPSTAMQMPTPTQQAPVQPMPIGLSGRVISDIAEVKANEVPMDGSSSYFVVSDGTAIYRKYWGADGSIFTTLYKPYIEPKQEEVVNCTPTQQQPLFDAKTEVIEPIFERIAQLEDKLDKLGKATATTTAKGASK